MSKRKKSPGDDIIGKTVEVAQIRSGAGRGDSVKRTLGALGLGRIGKKRKMEVNPSLFGMLQRVKHLVSVRAE